MKKMNETEQYLTNSQLHEKWAFLTEGLKGHEKNIVTTMLENQARFGGIRTGNGNRTGVKVEPNALALMEKKLNEDASVKAGIVDFQRIAFPLVRRIWGDSILLSLVSTQPMTLPAQKLFRLDYTAGTTAGGHTGAPTYTSFFDRSIEPDPAYVADPGECLPPNDAKLSIVGEPVVSQIMKLKADWSFEAGDEARAYHGLNFDNEITFAMGNIIRRDIEKVVLDDLIAQVDANIALTGGAGSPYNVTITNVAVTTADTFRQLQNAVAAGVVAAKSAVYAANYRHPNWWLVGADVVSILDRMDDFVPASNISNTTERALIGTFKGLNVYRDPFIPAATSIMGYQGSGMMETGYIFGPYIPLMVTPTFFDSGKFCNVKGVFSQFGKKMVRPEFFVKVTIV